MIKTIRNWISHISMKPWSHPAIVLYLLILAFPQKHLNAESLVFRSPFIYAGTALNSDSKLEVAFSNVFHDSQRVVRVFTRKHPDVMAHTAYLTVTDIEPRQDQARKIINASGTVNADDIKGLLEVRDFPQPLSLLIIFPESEDMGEYSACWLLIQKHSDGYNATILEPDIKVDASAPPRTATSSTKPAKPPQVAEAKSPDAVEGIIACLRCAYLIYQVVSLFDR